MRMQLFEELQPITPVRKGFRGGQIQFHDLMAGNEGRAENYGLQLVDVFDEYSTPQHRHNFEQVRVMLDGEFGFGPGQVQKKGSAGYFCEGTYYTQHGVGRSTTLLLQIGGPSRQGFMSRQQLRRGIDELAVRGTFSDGVFSWLDPSGKKHNQDSYEAVWEHVHGKPVAYPKPQYLAPVLLEPERFSWQAVGQGTQAKELGAFAGCGLSLAQVRVVAGASFTPHAADQNLLMFCQEGAGRCGDSAYRRWTTIEVQRGEQVALPATSASEWFVFRLPEFTAAAA